MVTDQEEVLQVQDLGRISLSIRVPLEIRAMLILAHGAGSNKDHPFLRTFADHLFLENIGTLRFNFLYSEQRKRRPDLPKVAVAAIHSVVEFAHRSFDPIPIFAGGKSFGGRMTSHFAAAHVKLRGLVFLGFPLHPPGKPGVTRAAHLKDVALPMLFLQGTRDTLADSTLITEVTSALPQSSLVEFEGADHSFNLKKKSIVDQVAERTIQWLDNQL